MKMIVEKNTDHYTIAGGASQWQDILRLLLILQIVCGHIAAITLPQLSQLLSDPAGNWFQIFFRGGSRFGTQAAWLFIFLSGYMVLGRLIRDYVGKNPISTKDFLFNRMIRIIPICWMAIFLTVVLDFLSIKLGGNDFIYKNSYSYNMIEAYNIQNLFGNLIFLQPVFFNAFGSNGPLWTVGYLMQFYIFAFVFINIIKNNVIIAIFFIFVTLFIMFFIKAEWSILLVVWISGGLTRQYRRTSRYPKLYFAIGSALFFASNLLSTAQSAWASIPIGFILMTSIRNFPLITMKYGGVLRNLSKNSFAVYVNHHVIIMFVYSFLFYGLVRDNGDLFIFISICCFFIICVSALFIHFEKILLNIVGVR